MIFKAKSSELKKKNLTQRGAVFLDFVLALAILGIIAQFCVVPAVGFINEKRAAFTLDNTARQIAGEIRYFEEMSLYYQRGDEKFSAADRLTAPVMSFYSDSCRIDQGMDVVRQITMPDGITISPNRKELSFKTGIAQPTTLELRHGDLRRYVIIDLVGRVRVSNYPPD